MRARLAAILLLTGFALAMPGCGPRAPEEPPEPALTLTPASYADLPGWTDDDTAGFPAAMARSCARLLRQPAERGLGPEGRFGRIADWTVPCNELATVDTADAAALRAALERLFDPWLAADNGDPDGLFTGYYEPMLRGARTPGGPFTTPLHRRPPDLVMVELGEFRDTLKGERIAGRVIDGRLRPFEDRAKIDGGALAGQGLELVWVDDPVDAFFLHIQGSGRVALDDGTELRVGYDGQNGHPYFAIGRELVARGALARDEVSLQSIRAWLAANPDAATELLHRNPSYVFFRVLEGDGPIGAQNVALTPGRSLAVDPRFVAYGVPLWLDAADPLDAKARIRRLMVAQDTGGAIRGPVRGDVFWGHGEDAELRAGKMRSDGRYWLLLPKGVVPTVGPRPGV